MPEAEETVTRQRGARVAAPRCRPRARVSPLEAVVCDAPLRARRRATTREQTSPPSLTRAPVVFGASAEPRKTAPECFHGTPRRPTCRGIPPSAVKATERRVGPRPGPLRRHPPCVAAPWLLSRARRRTSSTPRHPRRVPVRPGAASRVSGRRSTRRRVRGRRSRESRRRRASRDASPRTRLRRGPATRGFPSSRPRSPRAWTRPCGAGTICSGRWSPIPPPIIASWRR